MSINLTTETAPATIPATTSDMFLDNQNYMCQKDANSVVRNFSVRSNCNTTAVTCSSADTYLTGSSTSIPTNLLQAKSIFRWTFILTKSAAGTAASPTFIIRTGTAGTTSDTARCTFTSPFTQTAAVDTAWVTITAIMRNIGASGVLAASINFSRKNLTNAGFGNAATSQVWVDSVNSASFDTTTANLIVGVSCNPGATGSPVWTFEQVMAEAHNL